MGFTQHDVDTIVNLSPYNIQEQVKHFSKMWRMPDLSQRDDPVEILADVQKRALGIIIFECNLSSLHKARCKFIVHHLCMCCILRKHLCMKLMY